MRVFRELVFHDIFCMTLLTTACPQGNLHFKVIKKEGIRPFDLLYGQCQTKLLLSTYSPFDRLCSQKYVA